MKERLLEFLAYLGMGQTKFEEKVGLSRGLINKIKGNISLDSLKKITNAYPELNENWLRSGNGEMMKSDSTNEKEKEKDSRLISLYNVSGAAGYGSFDEMISKEKIIGQYLIPDFRDIDWMIYVNGSSMYPKYSSGDIIACRVLYESRFIQWGKVYVVATKEQGMLVKRLKKSENEDYITAVSDNKAYDPFDIPKDEILGIALVVGVIRME